MGVEADKAGRSFVKGEVDDDADDEKALPKENLNAEAIDKMRASDQSQARKRSEPASKPVKSEEKPSKKRKTSEPVKTEEEKEDLQVKEAREEGRFQVMAEKLDYETAEGLGLERCLDNLPDHFPRRDLAAVIIPEFTADGTKKENIWLRIGLGQMPASKQSMDIRGNRFHGSPMRFSESLAKDDWYLRDFACLLYTSPSPRDS